MTPAKGKAASPSKGEAAVAENEPREVAYKDLGLPGTGSFTIPAKLPFRVLRFLRSSDPGPESIVGLVDTILGEEQAETLWGLDIDMEQGKEFVQNLAAQYGLTPGESQASPTS